MVVVQAALALALVLVHLESPTSSLSLICGFECRLLTKVIEQKHAALTLGKAYLKKTGRKHGGTR